MKNQLPLSHNIHNYTTHIDFLYDVLIIHRECGHSG